MAHIFIVVLDYSCKRTYLSARRIVQDIRSVRGTYIRLGLFSVMFSGGGIIAINLYTLRLILEETYHLCYMISLSILNFLLFQIAQKLPF